MDAYSGKPGILTNCFANVCEKRQTIQHFERVDPYRVFPSVNQVRSADIDRQIHIKRQSMPVQVLAVQAQILPVLR